MSLAAISETVGFYRRPHELVATVSAFLTVGWSFYISNEGFRCRSC